MKSDTRGTLTHPVDVLAALARPGDLITSRTRGLVGGLIRYALSRGPDRCIVNHDAGVLVVDGQKLVLWHQPPHAILMPLHAYLAHHVKEGWGFHLYRPGISYAMATQDRPGWHHDVSAYLEDLQGQDYSERQLAWVLFGNILATKWLPFIWKRQWKAARFCTGSYHDALTLGPAIEALRWEPRAYKEARLPTPLHTQRAIIHGDFVPLGGNLHSRIMATTL